MKMTATSSITVTINGESHETEDQILIPAFLTSCGLDPQKVIVEWNGKAQTRAESSVTALSDGDRLEAVRLVAGG